MLGAAHSKALLTLCGACPACSSALAPGPTARWTCSLQRSGTSAGSPAGSYQSSASRTTACSIAGLPVMASAPHGSAPSAPTAGRRCQYTRKHLCKTCHPHRCHPHGIHTLRQAATRFAALPTTALVCPQPCVDSRMDCVHAAPSRQQAQPLQPPRLQTLTDVLAAAVGPQDGGGGRPPDAELAALLETIAGACRKIAHTVSQVGILSLTGDARLGSRAESTRTA